MSFPLTIYAERAFVRGSIKPAAFRLDGEMTPCPADKTVIRLDENYLLLPGLINSHDHLEFNSFPVLGREGAYTDLYEWAEDIQSQLQLPEIQAALKIPLEDRLRIGGLKNLFCGVTTVVHHNPYHRCFDRQFAVRVIRNYSWSHSLGLDEKAQETFHRTPSDVPWIIHAAEGISKRAGDEIDEMEQLGLLARNTVLVHALGATPRQMTLIAGRHAGVISCPVSNRFLYGHTLDFKALPVGTRMALGSDSAASASSGILEDLQQLRRLALWPEEKIWDTVTTVPFELFRIPIGLPDVVAFREDEPGLVVINGQVHLASEEFRHLFDDEPHRIKIRGRLRLLWRHIRVPWKSLARASEWTPYLREIDF